MKNLIEQSYLETYDMEMKDLMKYSKKELIRLIWFQCECEHQNEKEINRLQYGDDDDQHLGTLFAL